MLAISTKVVRGYTPEATPRRVLLFNPSVYDTRFPLNHLQETITHLQLTASLRHYICLYHLSD